MRCADIRSIVYRVSVCKCGEIGEREGIAATPVAAGFSLRVAESCCDWRNFAGKSLRLQTIAWAVEVTENVAKRHKGMNCSVRYGQIPDIHSRVSCRIRCFVATIPRLPRRSKKQEKG